MNLKLCKQLRREAFFHVGSMSTKYKDTVVKHVKIPTGKFVHIEERITRTMLPCTRSVYKKLKKEVKYNLTQGAL